MGETFVSWQWLEILICLPDVSDGSFHKWIGATFLTIIADESSNLTRDMDM